MYSDTYVVLIHNSLLINDAEHLFCVLGALHIRFIYLFAH